MLSENGAVCSLVNNFALEFFEWVDKSSLLSHGLSYRKLDSGLGRGEGSSSECGLLFR